MNVENMTIISKDSLNSGVHRIIDVYPASKNLQINQYRNPILMEMKKGDGNVVLFTGWLEEDANIHFTLWPYFNYFLYTMGLETLGESFQSFPDWDFSPVPHEFERIILLILIICLAILAVSLFVVVRRKSRSTIDQATIEALKKKAEEEEEKRIKEAEEFKRKVEEEGREDLKDDWEVIGIHRQLGGFLFTFFIGLFLVIPQLLVTNFVMPQFIQPYPQAAGWYYYAYNLFQIAWLLFDFGTSYALAKYFSQYRVKNPEKAIHYIQIFVWWQLFTGLIQISIFAFIGSIIFPYTNIAHMSWVLITFSLVQYPGFFLVFMFTFQGLQRADLHLITYVAWEVIWLLIGQVIFCYLGRLWGAANPIIGEALGAGIGYSVARYFDYWMTFILSFFLFKKQGYSPKTCFRIDFTKDEFKESMKYGSKLAFGESFVQIGWFLQIIITSTFIANYSNELGYFNLAWNVGMIVQLVTLYGQSLLGAFSESNSHGKKTLTKLYIYQAFRWGNYFAYFIISVLLATGGLFLVGAAGQDYGGPAVRFMPLILIFHGFGVYSWLVDAVFQGTGKTGYAALVWILEQTVRALLMFLLVILTRDMAFVIIAYWPAVFAKDIVAWIIVRYKIIKYKVYWYKTFITPLISAFINFLVLSYIGNFLWNIDMGDKIINTAIIFLVGIFLFMYFFAFLDGLFGGYDKNTIKEFEKATSMVKVRFIGFFPRALYKVAALGARISPLHNKFPIDIYEDGMAEAFELTLEKKVLKI
jgi:O-antigen/teichoic acid export membrane protein